MLFNSNFLKLYEELSKINSDIDLESIVDIVAAEVEKYDENGSNQNCLFSTWAVELQLRGENFLPRPVYSPRDPIFDIKGEELVVEPEVLKISSKEDVETQVLEAGDGARFYCHVNWADSKGGHEFLLINDNDSVLVVDGQAGYIKEINKDKKYFDDINFENSYIVRFDNKEINQDILKYNDEDQIIEWDDELDPSLLEATDENALSIEGVSSPEELMDWMNENITYELVDDEYSNSNGVPTKTAEEVLKTGTGHCAEQSYLEKEVLDDLGYETFLVMVKENNSKKEYGAEGSAHVFLVYKEGKNYCWFEHSMQHSRGIHKYTSLEALLQDVANQWWRYDENSDILEVRMMDKVITGVDNWGLAKECYKLPVEYTFDISNNVLEKDVPMQFDPPYTAEQIKDNYGEELYKKLSKDPAHVWRMETGLELIHREPEVEELRRIWANWQLMDLEQKAKSDEKSIELFGKTNAEHYKELISTYKESFTEELAQIEYRPLSDIELFKKHAAEILGGYGGLSDGELKSSIKEIYVDGKLVGYIGFSEYTENGSRCLGIGNFMIIERGKGLGTKVIQDIVERNKSKYDLIYCFVDAKNEGAIRLYKKLGKVYDKDGPNDNGEYYVTFYDNGRWELDESLEKTHKLVFLSDKNMNGKTLIPRVPNNFLIKNGYEDSTTPRVCFASSIDKALMAISRNLTGEELYVHQPKNINKKAIYKPTIKEVPDVKITGEIWYKEPVELECVGKILVVADNGEDGHKYTYGDSTAELYGWDWKWIDN